MEENTLINNDYAIPKVYSGSHCVVEIDSKQNLITKIIKADFSPQEAQNIIDNYTEYRMILIDNGFHIPQCFNVNYSQTNLFFTEEFIPGQNLKSILFSADTDINMLINSYQQFLDISLTSELSRRNQKRLFIDFKPENFVFYKDKLYIIDLYPPMIDDGTGNIKNYYPTIYGNRLQEHMIFNFGYLAGQITKLFALLRLEQNPNIEKLQAITLEYLEMKIDPYTYSYVFGQLNTDCIHQQYLYQASNPISNKQNLLSFLLSENYADIPYSTC